MVTVPAPTSRPRRDRADEAGPKVSTPVVSTAPRLPSEQPESEESFRASPRHSEVEHLPGVPITAEPIPQAAERATVIPTTRPPIATVVGYPPIEDPTEQIEALNRAADRLQMTVASAEEAEDRRENEYRQHEDERMQRFLENESLRNEDARQRSDAIWRDLEDRLAALPPVAVVSAAEEKTEPEEERAETESIEPAPQQVSAKPASDVMEMIQLARDEFAKEHERLANERTTFFDELREEKDRIIDEKNNKIHALEEELQQMRAEFQSERQQYLTEDADRREQERQERMAEGDDMRAQINDLTNLMQDSRNMIEEKKSNSDARYMEKQSRRQDKDAQMIEMRDMIQKIIDDREVDRARCEEDKRDIIEDLRRQNAELRESLQLLSDSKSSMIIYLHKFLTSYNQVGEQIVRDTTKKHLKLFDQLLISRCHLMFKVYVFIPSFTYIHFH